MQTLSDAQIEAWQRDGFLVLEGFFDDAEVAAIERCRRHAWESRADYVVVDILSTGRRCRLSQLDEAEREERFFKLNDLFLYYPVVREAALHPRLTAILRRLLGDDPVLCNSLNLLRSSQQPVHVDSIYMCPRSPSRLLASWIALEDAAPESGRLFYYPGSHRIPPFRFSNGGRHILPGEQGAWDTYIQARIAEHGLEPAQFSARRGDVLIWHSELAHGGTPAADPDVTRNSLVSHYWSAADCRAVGEPMVPLNAGFWIDRLPHPVEGRHPARGPRDLIA